MTDLSKLTLTELSDDMRFAQKKRDEHDSNIADIDAEIERRKSELDYAAWEPKWQAFRKEMGWHERYAPEHKRTVFLALIAAHNTPLAGEGGWTVFDANTPWPVGVTLDDYEIEIKDIKGNWQEYRYQPSWACLEYRYRPKQADEVLP